MPLGQSPVRASRHAADVPTAILDAAFAVMRERGVAGLNLNEVARRVGVRTPSLYEYFPGKMALYNELYRAGVRAWAGRIAFTRTTQFDTPWELLRAMIDAYLDFADDRPEMYQLIHERHVPGFEPSEDALAESIAVTSAGIDALATWMDRGELDPGMPADQAFDLFIVVLHGLVGAHVANDPGNRDPGERFRRLAPQAVALFQNLWTPRTSKGEPS